MGPHRQGWTQDPEGVRADIIKVAISEFAAHGLAGARIDEIAARTKTSKRMIYYYFGDKEGLYQAALASCYSNARATEEELDLASVPADEALARLIGMTFRRACGAPDFIRMVMNENLTGARHLRQIENVWRNNRKAIDRLAALLERGVAEGVFRPDVDPVKVHWMIAALVFFNMSNRDSFSILYGDSLFSEAGQHRLCEAITQMIVDHVRPRRQAAEVTGRAPA